MTRTTTVTDKDTLLKALASARGGDTILLAGGDYGDLALIHGKTGAHRFDSTVRIAAADPGNPPVFSALDARGVANLAFEGVTFDYTYTDGQPIWYKPFMVTGSTGVSFSHCTFDGDVARGLDTASNGYPTGFGLSVTASVGVNVTDSEFSGFFRGLVVSRTDDVVVVRNDLHGIRMDGMNFAAVQSVVIEDNHIHNFKRSLGSADHADMIQFWTNGTTRPSTDIVIRNNTLDIGEGHYTQSIFMRNDLVDRGLAGEEMFYRNVLIEGNVITNAHAHGITVGETAGLTIRNNSVLHADGANKDGADSAVEIPRINVAAASKDVTIVQNATAAISGHSGQDSWTVRKNAFVQDQNRDEPGWYGDVFLASSLSSQGGRHNFVAAPDSMLHRLEAGARETRESVPETAFQVTQAEQGGRDAIFDAALLGGHYPEGTVFRWDFGDGQTATGKVVEHTYMQGGTFQAKLVAERPDGTKGVAEATVDVNAAVLLSMQDDGTFLASEGAVVKTVGAPDTADTDDGLDLGATGVVASVARGLIAPMLSDESISISFSLDADTVGSTGEIFRLHGSVVASVDRGGQLLIQAWSSEGNAVSLRSASAVNDGALHQLELRLQDGVLSLWQNDKQSAEVPFAGSFANAGRHDLVFGNPWGKTNFDGDIQGFCIELEPGFSGDAAPDPHTTSLMAFCDPPLL